MSSERSASDTAVIRVEGLGKRYQIGASVRSDRTLRDALTDAARRLARRVGRGPNARMDDDTIWALRGVSFDVQHGEVVGIIGRNGAGKSTLLKIVSRITAPTLGRVWIRGRVGSLLEVGTGFHGELSGRENIYLNGAILGMRREEIARKFDTIVEFAEVGPFLDTPVKHYSSGMYLRLAFAVAAHLEPNILLVDEVLAVGDAAFQRKCLGAMSDARQDRTVLFVSHNLVAVESLCRRVLWLEGGQIRADGAASEVISAYLRTVSTAVTERTWSGDSLPSTSEGVRLHRVRICPADGAASDHLTVHTPFVFECEYWNEAVAGRLRVHLRLYDERDVLLFDVGPPLETPPPGSSPLGLLRTVCHVPGDLLNDGRYRLAVTIVRDHRPVIREAAAVVFDIHDSTEERDGWYERWPGAIRPRLRWDTELVVPSIPEALLTATYAAFNARDIDRALATMHADVEWPDGMEGGYVHGHAAVRDYWTRQWGKIDPHVEPRGFTTDEVGRIVVDVHQVVRDPGGTVLTDRMVRHVYRIESGLIRHMEIRK